ncbi:MAG: ribonuclease J, partial [Clostridia bacterium]
IPVFGTTLTLALVENKLRERGIDNVELVTVTDGTVVNFGAFSAEFIHVCHSVAGSLAISLTTPVGVVFHTGDFKIDYTPLAGEVMSLSRIAEIGKKGVALLLADSTNVERSGYTMSEQVVSETLKRVFAEASENRIIVATFASNVDRLQIVLDLAKEFNRKVAVSGRSMMNVVETATRVGYLHYNANIMIDLDKIDRIPKKNLVILSTGSQGEPMSALTRMASGEFNKVRIGTDDTVIISASPIPGNEKDIYRVINNLYRLGAKVIYSRLADVHVSGHACQEELKLMQTLIKPKYFIPVHGEYRHLKQHAALAIKMGVPESNILIAELGDTIELTKKYLAKTGTVQAGNVLVDGLSVGDVGSVVLRDRLQLSEDGMLIAIVGISETMGVVVSGPEIISRGFIYTGDNNANDIVDEMKQLVLSVVNTGDVKDINITQTKQNIQKALRNYLLKKLKRSPMILPVLVMI